MLKKGKINTLSIWNHLISAVALLALIMGNLAPTVNVAAQTTAQTTAPAVTADTLTLHVISANDSSDVTTAYGIHKGDPITQFKYIINIDNTGTTAQRSPAPGTGCSPADAGYPDSCNWVSIAGMKSSAPIYTQGNQDDFPSGAFTINGSAVHLPPGRYLISILADNYKIDGAHFTVPGSGLVTVEMQPYDLPAGTLQAEVFEDTAPTNSAPDVPAERGIAGFVGHIKDYIDEVTTNVYGDPLCGNSHCVSKCYVVDGGVDLGIVAPMDAEGRCYLIDELLAAHPGATTIPDGSDPGGVPVPATAVIEGKIKIPDLGPNRYALSVTPPNRSGWAQTTTLEGNHDWDAWVMEGGTGLDTEFVVAGEPFPAIFFGYVKESNSMAAGSGEIKGNALAVSAYIPPVGGIVGETGLLGAKAKDKNPIKSLYVSLSDLNNNDQTIFMKHYDCSTVDTGGCPFDITAVPDGDYVLGIWDEPQDYIFGEQNVSVVNGEIVDIGSYSMLGWWTTIEGHVFNDLNENGKMDPGEPGIPNFFISMRTRENSTMDRGTASLTTDANGYYWMESAYPQTQWLVEEAYADGFQTTGVTYQADNQPTETTIIGAGVDVNLHPVIGLGGRLDWGVKAYAPGTNGGIVGTVSYDTTRNELDPSYAAIEDWQPSISNLNVDLYAPVVCDIDPNTGEPAAGQICDPDGFYQLDTDGSYKTGLLLNQYVSETWQRPSGCIARNVDNNPLVHGVDEDVLPLDPNAPCLEAPMMGVQFGPMQDAQGTPDASFGATVDGNYGFGDGCFGTGGFDTGTGGCADGSSPTSLPANTDYIVKVEIPNDSFGRPQYQVTREEDINIANGDSFVPQVPPSACAGPLHTVDVLDSGTDNYLQITGDGVTAYNGVVVPAGVIVPPSSPVDNPTLAVDLGGTIYEGAPKPLCDAKLVHVSDRKSIAPGFNIFTDVPLPGRFWGLTVDDLNFSSNPKSTAYGEKLPVAFNPVGIYDYTNRLVYTAETDYNGFWDVLLPSTNRISCPTPSGVCANLYRFVGNDPGTPGHWNPNYDPQYRSIAAEFEAFPGLSLPADLAPTPVAVAVQIPGTQTITSVSCSLNDMTGAIPATNPEFFAINKPYVRTTDTGAARTFTLTGLAFGAAPGSVMLDNFVMTVNSWNDRQITFTVPASGVNLPNPSPHQLKIITAGGKSTINALTFHVLNPANAPQSSPYRPTVFEVGVGKAYDPASAIRNTGGYEHALQDALNDAANVSGGRALVVVYPGPVDNNNPRYNGRGAYYESIVIHSPVKLQGVGPGGVYSDGTPVQGTILDGIAFGGDTAMADGWRTLVGGLTWPGNPDISEGQVIYILPGSTSQFGSSYKAAIDGLDIRGGDQMGFPGNLNAIFGGFPGPAEAVNVETQGGAIFANAYANNLQITNNIVENNSGSYGAIRIGTPNIDTSLNNNNNVRIANNRIIANGGSNLAGAIGLFGGSNGYEVASNDLCGNFSAEYGGAISHFGRSNTGKIHDNRIYFNHSYDEGAGVVIAGELASNPGANYGQPGGPQGSGAVDIYNNLIQANMAEDDGGGLRFLMAGNFPMNVYNNMIVNNVSMHEGGGVAIDDAPNVRFYNNTVMGNKTTATAVTSDGLPVPAGLSTGANSVQLQATLPAGSPIYSNPLLFNDIFWDNRAGTKGINTVTGLTPGDAYHWDMGVVGTSFQLSPTNSILQSETVNHNDLVTSPTNKIDQDPLVVSTLDIPLSFTSWRTNVNFVGAIMVTADLPPQLLSNYHLIDDTSPAYNAGAANKAVPSYQQPPNPLAAPLFDIDNQVRPAVGGYDSGADEYPGPQADLSITKNDGVTTVDPTATLHYTIVVTNNGPAAVALAPVTDTVPAALTGVTWTCSASAGSSCGAASGSGNINTTVTLPVGGSATFTLNGTVAANATGPLANTASVAAPANATDPALGNNSATDTDLINLPFPNLGVLDTFNRTNNTNLGGNWSTPTTGYTINTNVLRIVSTNSLIKWNSTFGPNQEAYFTFSDVSTVMSEQDLVLKVNPTNTNSGSWTSMIEALYDQPNSQVRIETLDPTNGWVVRATFTGVTFATGDQFGARTMQDGTVNVYKNGILIGTTNVTSGANGWPAALASGSGRIGVWFIGGNSTAAGDARIDNFGGGTITPALVGFSLAAQPGQLFLPLITH